MIVVPARATIAWAVAGLALALVGGLLLATRYMGYDDEGYVLWSVRSFCAGHPLYDSVYTQYGPLFFLGYRTLCGITGLVLDSDSARLLTLAYWIGTSLFAGACARLLIGSLLAGLAGAGLAFLVLLSNFNEPFHPGSLLALISAIITWWGARSILRKQEPHLAVVSVALATCAALIKINVGGLLLIALGAWLICNGTGRLRPNRTVGITLGALLVVVPPLLMARHLGADDFRRYSAVVTTAVAGLFALIWQGRREVFPLRAWTTATAWAAGIGATVLGLLLWQGSSFGAIAEGILLGPLRHPGIYVFPPEFPPFAIPLAIGIMLLALTAPRFKHGAALLDLARITAVLWFLWECIDPLRGIAPDRFAFYYGPSLALLCVAPAPGTPGSTRDRAALWLAWIYIWQILHGYPVAGSQVAWGSFLWAPLALHGLHRSLARIDLRYGLDRRVPALLTAGLVAFATTRLALLGAYWMQDSSPLGFPAARWLHPQTQLAADIRHVRRNLLLKADLVFSLPGMFSFNLWTGLPSPTQANATHWFNLLDHSRQHQIIDALAADRRPALVVMPFHLDYLKKHQVPVGGPLVDYLRAEFTPAVDAGVFEIWLRRDQVTPPVDGFAIQPDGLEAWTEPLPAPVFAALLYETESNPAPVPDGLLSLWTLKTADIEVARPAPATHELRPSLARPWSTEPVPSAPNLVRHRLPIAPISNHRFSGRLLLDLVDRDGRVMASCRLDRLRQAINDAAPPGAN